MEQAQLTLDEVLEYVKNRPETTRTYQVPQGVIAALPLAEPPHMRLLSASEIQELADYLDTSPSSLKGPFKVFDATCSSCGRHITFLDFANRGWDLDRIYDPNGERPNTRSSGECSVASCA
ncbi:hypothetical protein ACWDA9_38805, partial [Streptomyces sp. NPDC001193]